MRIREFKLGDIDSLINILIKNNQYSFPEVDGPEAMKRVMNCDSAIFLVCEVEGSVIGFIRGSFDGSRAMIHQLSIKPKYQKKGMGLELVNEIVNIFKKRGANTVSANITEQSYEFWKKIGFNKLDVFLVGNFKKMQDMNISERAYDKKCESR